MTERIAFFWNATRAVWIVAMAAMPMLWVLDRFIQSSHFAYLSKLLSNLPQSVGCSLVMKLTCCCLLQKLTRSPINDMFLYDFAIFRITTSEAIGLRCQDINLTRGEITIASALARDEDGRSAGTSRVRKATKTETVRTLGIPPSLLAMLKGKAATAVKPDDLIFTTTRSKPIDDHSFSQRVWKKLCAAAGIPYRVPYASRHTVLTHGLESGIMTRTQAQYAAGHSDSRSIDAYIHMLQRPKLIDWQQDL